MIIPRSFPRVVQRSTDATVRNALFDASIVVSCTAIILVLVSMALTYWHRKKRCLVYAQTEFLAILLAGLFLVSTGALILAIPPTNGTCLVTIWLTNTGYTLELVPLVVKVAAINQLMHAAQKMRRVKINRRSLFGVVFGLSMVVVIFLIVWTILDRPAQVMDYQITARESGNGETIVKATAFCQSSSNAWSYASIIWHTLLLVCAAVLAFQTRKVQNEVNEAQTLAFIIYSHFVFVVLRVIVFSLTEMLNVSHTPRYFSLVFSIDVIATCFIYFIPKFIEKDHDHRQGSTYLSGAFLSPREHFPVLDCTSRRAFQVPASNELHADAIQHAATPPQVDEYPTPDKPCDVLPAVTSSSTNTETA